MGFIPTEHHLVHVPCLTEVWCVSLSVFVIAEMEFFGLCRITREVPALAPNYWEEVANRMSTRHTARDCSSKYMDVCTRPPTKRPVRQKQPGPRDEEQGDKKIVISGRAGTLKRKRQLRAAMEHMDKDYVDDIFDSTPFKKRVKTVVKVSKGGVLADKSSADK